MTPEEQIARSEQAKTLLENPLLKKSLLSIREEIFQRWSATAGESRDEREYLHRLLIAQQAFESLLLGYIETGKIVRDALQANTEVKNRRQTKSSMRGLYGN